MFHNLLAGQHIGAGHLRGEGLLQDGLPSRLSDLLRGQCLTDKQTNRPTDKQPNRQTDKQTNRQTDKQTNRQTDKQTNRQTDKQTNRQTDKQTNRQADKQTQYNRTPIIVLFIIQNEKGHTGCD